MPSARILLGHMRQVPRHPIGSERRLGGTARNAGNLRHFGCILAAESTRTRTSGGVMTNKRDKRTGLVLLLSALGVLALAASAGAALFMQTPGLSTIRPIVTDRPINGPVIPAATSASGTPGKAAASSAGRQTQTAARSTPTPVAPSPPAASSRRATSQSRRRTSVAASAPPTRRASPAATSPDHAKRPSEGDREVVKPTVRDEEHADGVTRTWPYTSGTSPDDPGGSGR
jgi:hypothetical protein